MLLVTAGGIAIGVVIGVFFSRSHLVRPITSLAAVMEAVALGDSSVITPGAERHDEIGSMSRPLKTTTNA